MPKARKGAAPAKPVTSAGLGPHPAADSAGEASDRMTGDPALLVGAASPGEPEAVEKLDEATERELWFG